MDNPENITSVIKNINVIHQSRLKPLEKLALFVTEKIGTMGFFFFILLFNLGWIIWNTLAPKNLVFDQAFSFLILLLINNILQILFMPLIMVGQNLQGRHAELRAEQEFRTDVKAAKEIEVILLHLENQQKLMQKMLEKIEELTRRK
ncbi:MAG: DUF1003 domain-containing protein [Candidatus Daviesbacteria bacterium]|nr:DUF1003 domain-containing protein [Candidatus Daviesbacteria bacterium]